VSIFRSAASAATLLATATMIASPVAAATRTVPIKVPLSAKPARVPAWSIADETFNDHRWGRYRRHHDGIDGGDLLGVLLIGGAIAAMAGAIDKDREERRGDRTDGRDYPGADRAYDYRDGPRGGDRDYGRGDNDDRADRDDARGPGADRAVDACSAEAARSGQVDEIFDVEKIDGEWRVKGDYRNGREFTCTVDGNGRAYVGVDDQASNDPRNAPTGGDEADDRYATAQSPDFADPRGR